MRTLVINPANGVAGDMLIAALVQATNSGDRLQELFAPLGAQGWCTLSFREVTRSSVRAIYCEVTPGAHAPSLSLDELRWWASELIDDAKGTEIAMAALDLLGGAEQMVHGGGAHLHELASVDTLVDIAGVAYLCALNRIDGVSIMPIGVNFGSLSMAHGHLPLPGPAVAALLARTKLVVTVAPGEESVTPTGAALLAALDEVLIDSSAVGTIQGVGYGAGARDSPDVANVCQVMIVDDSDIMSGVHDMRAFIDCAPNNPHTPDSSFADPISTPAGPTTARSTHSVVVEPGLVARTPDALNAWVEHVGVIETYLDDVSGEVVGAFIEESLRAGALDAYVTATTGKKSRPGMALTMLTKPQDVEAMVELVQRRLGSPGVRFRIQQRRRLEPSFVEVGIDGQVVTVKVTSVGAKPEFEDLRRVSQRLGIEIAELRDRVMALYRATQAGGDDSGA
ncbi:MAG: DUF111 family protein [Ferrimicrobium sp.]|jgi:uncharacterized protein (TIGR00299 family) protein|nr:DUF111 family protein [Ferrimicrobium sp.]